MNLNRKGKFTVSRQVILSTPDDFLQVQNQVLIVDSEPNFVENTVTYYGYSEHFDEVAEYTKAPEYLPTITKTTDGNITVEWRRL
jgi:type IV secretory pathway TraG/TraD family ATPase VirD4